MSVKRLRGRGPDTGGWQSYLPKTVPSVLRNWLTETGSLTQRARNICSTVRPFGFQVLTRDTTVYRDERSLLRPHAGIKVREILMTRNSVPLIFAHSLITRRDLRGAWEPIGNIGGRALGYVLFTDRRVRQGLLYFRRLDARHPFYQAVLPWCGDASPRELWARRAVFTRIGQPLLVTEVFLPEILSNDA